MAELLDKQRLDKWLWAARFFKTRVLAAEAINGGKVHLNSERSKPGRTVKIGDQLHITRGHVEYNLVIEALNAKRRPAKEAVMLYSESTESIEKRVKRIAEMKAQAALMPADARRPSKKGRRQIVRFKREHQ